LFCVSVTLEKLLKTILKMMKKLELKYSMQFQTKL